MNKRMEANRTPFINTIVIRVVGIALLMLSTLLIVDGYKSAFYKEGSTFDVVSQLSSEKGEETITLVPPPPFSFWSMMFTGVLLFLVYCVWWILVTYLSPRDQTTRSLMKDAIKRNW